MNILLAVYYYYLLLILIIFFLKRKVDLCAEDSGLKTSNLHKLSPFTLDNEECVLEIAKLLTINFVLVLKSPVIVTRTFVDSIVSFLSSQPKHHFHLLDGASSSSSSPSSSPSVSSPSTFSYINSHYIVECMSTMDTIRALCLPGLFSNIYLASEMANQIIKVCEYINIINK